MKFRSLSVLAAVALLAACSANDETTTISDGTGSVAPATTETTGVETSALPTLSEESEAWFVQNVGDRVFFAFDSYALTDEARRTLELQAAYLKRFPSKTIVVEGHADERGTREYNFALGERRANSVKDYISALGIAPGRVNTISYGKERPAMTGHDESAWSANRRGVTAFR